MKVMNVNKEWFQTKKAESEGVLKRLYLDSFSLILAAFPRNSRK